MGYVDKVLGPNEQVVHETGLHWVTFVRPLVWLLLAPLAFSLSSGLPTDSVAYIGGKAVGLIFVLLGLVGLLRALIDWWTTEIAVTTRRVIFKRGLIARDTIELNFKRIEGLDVRQSITGRILRFGTVSIRGTGVGYQPMHNVADPIELRNAAFGET